MDAKTTDIEMRLLLDALFYRYGYDFRNYSMASMKRRLSQACEHLECRSFSILQDMLLHDPGVLDILLGFLTVQVSEMFRDPEYFVAIREKLVPHLKTYPSLKIWIAGCSTGEELYSLAILFREEGLEQRSMFYATDINRDALKRAQEGIFPLERMQLFTQNYQAAGGRANLSDYYTAAYDHAVFDKSLRNKCVFSDHSLVTDSVFAEMQFVSCRNVMIYFNAELQDRAIGLFHNSLCHRGFLGIGAKETLRFCSYVDAFDEIDKKTRLYQKREEA